MEALFTPHGGLMIWTVLTFLLLVGVLGRFGWKPMLQALEAREQKMKEELSQTEAARQKAEQLQANYESRWAEIEKKAADLLAQAQREGQKAREEVLKLAQAEATALAEKTHRQLAQEQVRLAGELRGQVATLALEATEKILRDKLTTGQREKLLQEALGDLATWTGSVTRT